MANKYITQKSNDYAILDKHTGEILDFNQVKKVSLDEFIMVFFTAYSELFKLEGQKLKILMLCWRYSTFGGEEGNIVINDACFKKKVREYEPTISDSNIDSCISFLTKRGLLIRQCKGRYELNPQYFFKGSLSDRSHLKLCVEVDPKNKIEVEEKDGKKSFCFLVHSVSVIEDKNT